VVAILAVALGITSCATAGGVAHYSVEFDALRDSPEVEILNYQYGDQQKTFFSPERERIKLGQIFKSGNLTGFLPRGDFLYVKWRIKSTGEVLEDRVDLRNRLPESLEDLRIHFVCHGRQLYVFVGWPWDGQPWTREPTRDRYKPVPGGVKRYEGNKIQQIYPDILNQ
jgi:hypothetical protein